MEFIITSRYQGNVLIFFTKNEPIEKSKLAERKKKSRSCASCEIAEKRVLHGGRRRDEPPIPDPVLEPDGRVAVRRAVREDHLNICILS